MVTSRTVLTQILSVQLKFTTAFHLQGDGQAERMIQKVVQILHAMVRPDQCDWAVKLSMAEFVINVSSNTSTGFSLFELIYGHMAKMCLTAPPSDYPHQEKSRTASPITDPRYTMVVNS